MFDLGWSELMVIAVIAIIVIGPKDLPRTLRTVGRWVGKARAVAREFQSSMEDLAREGELEELRKDLKSTTDFNIKNEIEKSVDPTGTLDRTFDLPSPSGGERKPAKETPAKEGAAPDAALGQPADALTAAPREGEKPKETAVEAPESAAGGKAHRDTGT